MGAVGPNLWLFCSFALQIVSGGSQSAVWNIVRRPIAVSLIVGCEWWLTTNNKEKLFAVVIDCVVLSIVSDDSQPEQRCGQCLSNAWRLPACYERRLTTNMGEGQMTLMGLNSPSLRLINPRSVNVPIHQDLDYPRPSRASLTLPWTLPVRTPAD